MVKISNRLSGLGEKNQKSLSFIYNILIQKFWRGGGRGGKGGRKRIGRNLVSPNGSSRRFWAQPKTGDSLGVNHLRALPSPSRTFRPSHGTNAERRCVVEGGRGGDF